MSPSGEYDQTAPNFKKFITNWKTKVELKPQVQKSQSKLEKKPEQKPFVMPKKLHFQMIGEITAPGEMLKPKPQ